MTIEETIQELSEFQKKLKTEVANKLGTVIAVGYANAIRDRVMGEKKNYNNSRFSPYSTKPIYVNPKNSPKELMTTGKTGKSVFNSGKQHKTKYFAGGYRDFRSTIGRPTEKNFFLTGEMWRGFGVKNFGETTNGATAEIGGRTPESQRKINENSKQEGYSIIEPTKQEYREVQQVIEMELQRLIEIML